MNLFKSFLCFSLLLLFVESAKAQDDRTRVGFGLGVGISLVPVVVDMDERDYSGLAFPASFHNFTFVVRVKSFRFEPNFGIFSYSEDRFEKDPSGTYKWERTVTNWRLGAVIAYAYAIASLNIYYGINIGVILSSASKDATWTGNYSNSYSDEASKTDFVIGPSIGGEYMFSDNFSLGGEIQINYISVGQFDWEQDEGSTLDVSTSVISTNGIVMVRWYIN